MKNLLLTLFLLAAVGTAQASARVVLSGRLANAEGVRWAAGELTAVSGSLRFVAELARRDLGLDDGYLIEKRGGDIRLSANSEGATIYGLLDLRDRLKLGKPIPKSLRFRPALRLRGTAETFPFWAGTTMYSNFWKVFEKCEKDPKCWWWDRRGWTARFREAASRRVNCFVFSHPHPYPAVLVYDRFTEAQVYDPESARRNAEMFKWIITEGKKYGVSIYFLTWNIVVPPAFAKAHGVQEFGAQDQIVKDYTRYCVRKLFETYPDLGGLITMGAETPVGCTDWVIENVISAMNECSPKPNLIWWGWCTYPEDSLKVKRAYKGRTEVMHYLQYEQYFKPMADPRIGRWSRETGGTKMIAIGGPKSAHCYYTWGDPAWARETVRSLKEDNNGSGLILETWMSQTWLAREAFCKYMWDLQARRDKYSPREAMWGLDLPNPEWARRIGNRYSPAVADDLLFCYTAASRIIPRFLCLVHSQSDHFQPQLGLPLVYYLEMPSLSTYVFEWYDGVNKQGRLVPNYGLTWPNPDWGEKVLPIKEYAHWWHGAKTRFTSTTPDRIADDIECYSGWVLYYSLDRLERIKPKNNMPEYQQTLKILRMNAYWGMQAAWKIRAAIAWAQFKQNDDRAGDKAEECLKHLRRSLDWYRKLTDLASEVYPNRMHFYLSFLASQPPWRQNDIWFSYQPTNQHWRDMLPRYERELALIEEQLKLGPARAQLPLTDQLWAESEKRVIASFDFESDDPMLRINPPARSTHDPGQVISGQRSLVCDTRGQTGEWFMFLTTDPAKLALEPGKRYQVRFKYRVLANPGKHSQPFAAAARTTKGDWQNDIGTFRSWSAPAGSTGERVFQIEPRDFDDYYLFILIRGEAALVVDDLTIGEL